LATLHNIKESIYNKYRAYEWNYRLSTWHQRAVPNFIIIGAQKSGTTSLFDHIKKHPQAIPSFSKEVHFFDGGIEPDIDNFNNGEAWYRAHFPFKSKINKTKTFEASPLYIFNPYAPQRIYDYIPRVKLIAILRNPVERAISQYYMNVEKGYEHRPLSEALKEEDQLMEDVKQSKAYKSKIFLECSYKSRGVYINQIQSYLKYFSKDQLLILSSEALFTNPLSTLQQIFEFVNIDSGFKPSNLKPKNVTNSKQYVNQGTYDQLYSFFEPYNEALFDLIGKRFNW